MKKTIVVLFAALALAACGGGGGGGGASTAQQAINNAIAAFQAIQDKVDADFDNVCTAKTVYDCSAACSNSGATLDLDDVTQTATMNNCQDSGLTFTGTLTGSTSSFALNMQTFGECTNVHGSVVDSGVTVENCSGTVTATCLGENVTCEMDSNCDTCTVTSGGGGTTNPALAAAMEGYFGALYSIPDPSSAEYAQRCVDVLPAGFDCDCLGGGTLAGDLSTTPQVYTFTTCVDDGTGLSYTGVTNTTQDPMDSSTVTLQFDTMTTFGQCTGLTGSVTITSGPSCSNGTINATCPAVAGGTETVSCTISADCQSCY